MDALHGSLVSRLPLPRVAIVIPARMHSTRLAGKMLLRETGKSLIQHTHEAAMRSERADAVIVATDHEAIAAEVTRFGGRVILTSPDHPSGADRVAEVARQLPQYEVFVNLQGDEPEIEPACLDQVVAVLTQDTSTPMATLATPLLDQERLQDQSNVKVVFDASGRALYFSRSPIPFVRDPEALSAALSIDSPRFFHHLGIYAYRRDFLLQMAQLPPSPLEQTEKLEQLRVLEAGQIIRVGVTTHAAAGIDTPADYAAFVRRQARVQAA
ncbi:3-deoxy-manno-octulosonate cytidylyltransferase [Botrimarina hoheduenensis]|uniref:3-deoxy-manno-octulosonate cytidylyltransferase n=1 Tax=Botrimarina hoheduenensis TaxID=2528000 RepID=A0A5C5WA03_9BACT|nr:3-deoxy-manno-octulosonate cytidylyltransferase [Botrimarina hoheduenensis]TWT47480.1 3-deoxy-manno-octulosonate cytidylyltransferase [Botrimarina hoheduenensis]